MRGFDSFGILCLWGKSDTWKPDRTVQLSPLRGHRDSVTATGSFFLVFVIALVVGASIPIEDFIDFDIGSGEDDHQGVSDIGGGFGYGSVVEDGCVGCLGHPPADQKLELSVFPHLLTVP